MKNAQNVYKQLRESLDANGIHYDCNDSEMNVWFVARGSERRILVDIYVDSDMQYIKYNSPFEFSIPSEIRGEVAIAINKLNFSIVNGHLMFNYDSGQLSFVLESYFVDSILSDSTFKYLLGTVFSTVNNLSNKFYLLSEGKITVDQLLKDVLGE